MKALVIGMATTVVVLAVVWFLDWSLFRPDAKRSGPYLLGLGATTAGLATICWLGVVGTIDFHVVRFLAVGLCLARPLLGAVQTSKRPRSVWWQMLSAIAVWNVALGAWALFGSEVRHWGALVWDNADQGPLFRHSAALLHGDFREFTYQIGLPILLAPAALLTEQGLDPASVEGARVAPTFLSRANLTNTLFIPITAAVVMPFMLWGVARAAVHAAGLRVTSLRVAMGTGITAIVVFGYMWLPPDHVPLRNSELVPRRLLGLVYGMEPLGMAAIAGAMVLLAMRGTAWRAVPVGIIAGYMAMLSERFIPTVVLFIVVLFLMKAQRRRSLVVAGTAFLTFLPQLLYFRMVYGGWLFPNRETQWVDNDKATTWSNRAQNRFGLPEGTSPSRMSLDYVMVNGADMIRGHWPVLVLVVLSLVLLFWRRPQQWPLWTFCAGHIAVTGLLSAMYINIVVTWRYNGVILPAVALLLAAGLWTLVAEVRARTTLRGRADPAAPTAPEVVAVVP